MIATGGGSIVYISSGSGIKGFVKETAYTPAKHGQEGLMKVLSMGRGGVQHRCQHHHAGNGHQHADVGLALHRGTAAALGPTPIC